MNLMTTLEQMLDDISVNEQNSIRIDGEKILYFDPFIDI